MVTAGFVVLHQGNRAALGGDRPISSGNADQSNQKSKGGCLQRSQFLNKAPEPAAYSYGWFTNLLPVHSEQYPAGDRVERMQHPDWAWRQGDYVEPVEQVANVDQKKIERTIGVQIFGPVCFQQHRDMATGKDQTRDRACNE